MILPAASKSARVLSQIVPVLLAGCLSSSRPRGSYVVCEDIADRLYASADTAFFVTQYDELLYMVNKENPKAIRAVVRVLPAVIRGQCQCADGGADDGTAVMAMAVLNCSTNFHFLDELSTADKELMLKYYAGISPADFGDMLENYLRENPSIRRAMIGCGPAETPEDK